MVTTGYELDGDDTLSGQVCMQINFSDPNTPINYQFVCVHDEFVAENGKDDDWTVDLTRKVYAVSNLVSG